MAIYHYYLDKVPLGAPLWAFAYYVTDTGAKKKCVPVHGEISGGAGGCDDRKFFPYKKGTTQKRTEYLMLRGKNEDAEEALATSCSYLEMKAWFLAKFPAVEEFHKQRKAILATAK